MWRSTKKGTDQLHQEFLILRDHTWKSSGRTWAQGNRLQVKGNLCLGTCLRLHQCLWIQQGKSWDFFTDQDVHQWHQFRMSRSLSLEYSSLSISAPLLHCCYIYPCCCQSFRCQFAPNRTDTNCSYHFLKRFFLELCFTLALLQQWSQMIVFSHRLGDTARGISRTWNLNTWSLLD